MVVEGNNLLVVGDDSPWLFTLDKTYQVIQKSIIEPFTLNKANRINKKIKPDFEAMTKIKYKNQTFYLLLGSGSKKHTRENGYLISINQEIKEKLSLNRLYTILHDKAGFHNTEKINIEGISTTADKSYIFNRGNNGPNIIFEMNTNEMLAFIKGEKKLPSLAVHKVILPTIEGYQAGLSGVDFWVEDNSLIFSASVEGSDNSIDDGKVLGSFIGVLPISKLTGKSILDLTPYSHKITHNNQTVLTKIESVAIDTTDKYKVKGYFVSDNDDGTSQFFEFEIVKDPPS
nr:hypothetical protein [Psychromonas aquimarina]